MSEASRLSVQPLAGAALVIAGGVAAALHVGKLPPALPVLQQSLGVTLVQAGFLLAMVQLAGMSLGLAVGAAAEGIGLRRTMVAGLVLLAMASLAGAAATTPAALLFLRAGEGMGFLLASLPAPALIRRLSTGPQLQTALGWWGAYMPLGTAMALLAGPWCMAQFGWPGWWRLLALLSLAMAVWLWWALPTSCDRPEAGTAAGGRWRGRLDETLRSAGPWLAALAFSMYSAQWLAVIGFLPTIYAQAGLAASQAAAATALAAAVNAVGNIASGRLLRRGWPAQRLLRVGFAAMGGGAVLAFAPWAWAGAPVDGWIRFGGVLVFSMVGGLVPGTLFSLAVRVAPSPATVSTTVGWMQQWSSLGQFAGPPLVAWVAGRTGDWGTVWWVTVGFASAGWLLAGRLGRLLPR